jgi:hypothetical protein
MSSNNLRIIYNNILDLPNTILASSTASAATPVSNLKLDSKSQVWRSQSTGVLNTAATGSIKTYTVRANLVVNLTPTVVGQPVEPAIIGGVVLPFCNLSSVATIRVRGYTGVDAAPGASGTNTPVGVAGGTEKFDTGKISACPYQTFGLWNWGSIPLGVNSYSYGGGTYARAWAPVQVACNSILIEIEDLENLNPYIEVSRIVAGSYWSPKYNTSFGLSTGSQDLSQHERSESGDLITNRGIRYRNMKFDLTWLPPADRLEFNRILRGNGLPRPLFISLFPDNSADYEKEQAHQIYGKLSQLSDITHPIFEMYSTSIDIEEI